MDCKSCGHRATWTGGPYKDVMFCWFTGKPVEIGDIESCPDVDTFEQNMQELIRTLYASARTWHVVQNGKVNADQALAIAEHLQQVASTIAGYCLEQDASKSEPDEIQRRFIRVYVTQDEDGTRRFSLKNPSEEENGSNDEIGRFFQALVNHMKSDS